MSCRLSVYNDRIIVLSSLLLSMFTSNLLAFTNMTRALLQLIKEGKISTAAAKTLIMLINKNGIPIPKNLEEFI
jgi:hypothetical protein